MKLQPYLLRMTCALVLGVVGLIWLQFAGFAIVHSSALLVFSALLSPGIAVIFFDLALSDLQFMAVVVLVNMCYWYGLLSFGARLWRSKPARD